MSAKPRLIGAVEAGGTKFVCAIGDEFGRIIAEERFPTTVPEVTVRNAVDALRLKSAAIGPLAAISVGSFGPIELNERSAQYGFILSTPKPGWRGTELAGVLAREFACPVGF